MSDAQYIILIIGMGLVTYLPRWIPLITLSQRKLPLWIVEWLDLIPVAILGALLLPLLITTDEPKNIELFRPQLLAAIPVSLFALKTKSLSGTIIVGMFLFWLISKVL
jgi:branched-subunit amino acid transport protein